ncbi:MAG: hypothetical protein AAFY56_13035, partial [Pseudomonadota bacterium]
MAIFTVQNTNDSGGGSLRQAILDANSNGNDGVQDEIILQIADNATILLTSGEVEITEDLLIDGSGQAVESDGISRIFDVQADAEVDIDELHLLGGDAYTGGAIQNAGMLTLVDTHLSQNSADYGGAIYNRGTLEIKRGVLNDNFSAYDGGAIFNEFDGIAHLSQTELNGNIALNSGGAIYSDGILKLKHSIVGYNYAQNVGGGVYGYGSLEISHSDVVFNESANDGGGIFVGENAYAEISKSFVGYNYAADNGGGISIDDYATIAISSSEVSH